MALQLDTQRDGDVATILAEGEVDLYSSPNLRDAILGAIKAGASSVRVNLSSVQYMDSSGVATLVEGLKASQAKKAQFSLVALSEPVNKVLQLSRLDSVFDIQEA